MEGSGITGEEESPGPLVSQGHDPVSSLHANRRSEGLTGPPEPRELSILHKMATPGAPPKECSQSHFPGKQYYPMMFPLPLGPG